VAVVGAVVNKIAEGLWGPPVTLRGNGPEVETKPGATGLIV